MKKSCEGFETLSRISLKIYLLCGLFLAAGTLSAVVIAKDEASGSGSYSTALINVTARDAIDLSGQWNYIVDPQKIGILRGDRRLGGDDVAEREVRIENPDLDLIT